MDTRTDSSSLSDRDSLTAEVIGAAIEVHKALGPGLLESAYEACLCQELLLRSITFERQVPLPIVYKGITLDVGYRIDLLISNCLIVELKTVQKLEEIHRAQLMTYLRLSGLRKGLLLNFCVPYLRDGIIRVVM